MTDYINMTSYSSIESSIAGGIYLANQMRNYDYSLDAIKGFSCILMIIAHVPIYFNGNERYFQVLAGLAPILFFAVSGVTTTFQSQRRSFRSLFYFYSLFGVLGFSYNLMWRPDYHGFLVSDIPQIIALGVLSIYLIEKYLKPGLYIYSLISIVIFSIHIFFGRYLPDFPLKNFLFADNIGFAYFPWFFAFSAGVFAYRCKNILNLILAIASTLLLSILLIGKFNYESFIKYNMSIEYFLLSLILLFSVFYICRKMYYSPQNIILFLGRNSFIYLFFHLFFIFTLDWLGLSNLYILIIWCLVFICTYFAMRVAIYLNRYIESYFNNKLIWLLLVISTVTIPFLISPGKLVILCEFLVGVLFSLNYKSLSSITKSK